MAEFEIDGRRYRSGTIPPMSAVHVLRKVAPFIPSLAYFIPAREMLAQIKANGMEAQIAKEDVDDIAGAVTPTLEMLSAMSTEDVEFVFAACFAVCEREQTPGMWTPIWSAQAKDFMFRDGSIDVLAMGRIVWEVLKENVGPLAAKLLSSSAPGTTAPSSTPSA